MTLGGVRRLLVPTEAAEGTEQALREAGAEGFERFVLWSGSVEGEVFRVRTVHVPAQKAFRGGDGVCVRVDGEVLHDLNVWLYEHAETLGVQVHTHPETAYHSDTDDRYPIVTLLGGFSLVVPDFCAGDLIHPASALYRLGEDGWSEVELGFLERI